MPFPPQPAIGLYRVVKDWPVRVSNAVFTVREGAAVSVTQLEPYTSKALVVFGREADWISYGTLNNYCEEVSL